MTVGLRCRDARSRSSTPPWPSGASWSPCRTGARSAACWPSAAATCAASATDPCGTPSSRRGVVTADGLVAKVGGPTVKNVSGFDLARLLVGSLGTLALMGDVILRTRPRPAARGLVSGPGRTPTRSRCSGRCTGRSASSGTARRRGRCLEGDAGDVRRQAAEHRLEEVAGPPNLPPHRSSVPPGQPAGPHGHVRGRDRRRRGAPGRAVAGPPPSPAVVDLHRALRARFDPTGRLNPGRDPSPADRSATDAPWMARAVALPAVAGRSGGPVGGRHPVDGGRTGYGGGGWTCTWWTTSWRPASAAACACPTARRSG